MTNSNRKNQFSRARYARAHPHYFHFASLKFSLYLPNENAKITNVIQSNVAKYFSIYFTQCLIILTFFLLFVGKIPDFSCFSESAFLIFDRKPLASLIKGNLSPENRYNCWIMSESRGRGGWRESLLRVLRDESSAIDFSL